MCVYGHMTTRHAKQSNQHDTNEQENDEWADTGGVLCDTREVKVAMSGSNTTNLCQHPTQHREQYGECVRVKAQARRDKEKDTMKGANA